MIDPTSNSSAGFGSLSRAAPSSLLEQQRDFAEVLSTAERRIDRAANTPDRETEARRAAEDLVAATLIDPVFKALRESDDAAPPFAPTQAEKQFRALADAQTARQIVRSGGFALVDAVAQRLLGSTSATETERGA